MKLPAKTMAILTAVLCISSTIPALSRGDDGFRPLFNGKDLTNWVLVNTPPSTWQVKDSMLICNGKPFGEIRTEQMYQNFVLELEWRHMIPKGNAGIFLWADDITATGVPFHRGIEVQVLENDYGNTQGHTTHGDIFPIHGATMDPLNGRGGSRAFPTESRSNPSPAWNHYRIVCQNGDISLAVNGKVVTRGKNASPRKGYICLESEGGVVHYRNLRIKPLPNTPVAKNNIAIASRGYRSLYNGLDLSGWEGNKNIGSHWHSQDWVLQYDPRDQQNIPISTAESFANFGFVIDFQLRDENASLEILLPESKKPSMSLTAGNDTQTQHHVTPNQWHRLEGSLSGNIFTVSLNGNQWLHEKRTTTQSRNGPLTLAPKGPASFTNLYIRQVSPTDN